MQSTKISSPDKYPGVDPDFIESIILLIESKRCGTINFFDDKYKLQGHEGHLLNINKTATGTYLEIGKTEHYRIRIDKIVTILGRPGPSYDAYDRFAHVCLTCEDLGQF